MVDGDRNSLVSQFCNQFNRLQRIVISESVRVVTEIHRCFSKKNGLGCHDPSAGDPRWNDQQSH